MQNNKAQSRSYAKHIQAGDAPSDVSKNQLEELGLKINIKDK